MSTTDQRIEKMSSEFRSCSSSTKTLAFVSLAIAITIFGIIIAYFQFGLNEFRQVTEPKQLVAAAETLLNDQITETRKMLQDLVNDNAENWAEALSDEAVDTVPKMRLHLEDFVTAQIGEQVKRSIDITDPEFEKLLCENNEPLKNAFKELATNKDATKELVAVITAEIDARLKADVQADADNVLNMMRLLKNKVKKLKSPGNLTDEEKLERSILTTARLIQEKQID